MGRCGRAAGSLGAVVPVVVDVDSSGDATDNEWDPSRDQIEPGKEWGLVFRTPRLMSLSHPLSPRNDVRFFGICLFVCLFLAGNARSLQGKVSSSLRDLTKTVLRDRGQNCFLSP